MKVTAKSKDTVTVEFSRTELTGLTDIVYTVDAEFTKVDAEIYQLRENKVAELAKSLFELDIEMS